MAALFDAQATSPTQFNPVTTTQTDSTLTITASGTLLLVWVSYGVHTNGNLPTSASATWNGVSMTLIQSIADTVGLKSLYLFGLLNPATGNHTVSVTTTGGLFSDCSGGIFSVSYKGTDTSTLATAVPSANVITNQNQLNQDTLAPNSPFTVTTASGDMAVAGINMNNTNFPACASGKGTFLADLSNFNANAEYGDNPATTTSMQIQFTGTGGNNQHICGIAARIIQGSSVAPITVGQTSSRIFRPGQPPDHGLRSPKAFPPSAASYTLPNTAGTFTISGQNATETRGITLANSAGVFTISGQAATETRGIKLANTAGVFTISGQAATETRGITLANSAGAFVISGQAATLTLTPASTVVSVGITPGFLFRPGRGVMWDIRRRQAFPTLGVPVNYTLPNTAGVFTISGQNSTTAAARNMAGVAGSFAISGQAATETRGIKLPNAVGAFIISGQPATETRGIKLANAAGAFVINGGTATLSHGFSLAGVSGSFTISGQSSHFATALSLHNAQGVFVINGKQASLVYTPAGGGPKVPHNLNFFVDVGRLKSF